MTSIIDASTPCDSKASALSAAGIRTVIRYYSRDTVTPSKRLSRAEAEKLAAAGLRLGVVHEGRFGNQPSNFDRASGVADATYARTYGAGIIGQPAGSTIYFGVDFDARPAEIRDRVMPYFRGIADAFAKPTGEPNYVIGVYGSGATCKAIIDAGLAQRAWLAQSKGWSGYTAFLKSGLWALSQGMETEIARVKCDPDTAGEGHDIGDFALPPTLATAPAPSAAAMRVNARSGLRLRYGPGVEFDSAKLLPLGTVVYPIKSVGPWTMVGLQGDGIADGFVSGPYLSDAMVPSISPAPPSPYIMPAFHTTDAMHVPELIRQGSSAGG